MSKMWTEEQVLFLKDLCASEEKLSAPAIAVKITEAFSLSPPLTRAAIVGIARRRQIKLPLPRTPKKVALDAKATPQHSFLAFPQRREHTPERRQMLRCDILPEPTDGRGGVYLLNASDLDCKRPINNPPKGQMDSLRVCGNPVTRRPFGGTGYCDECAQRILTAEGYGNGPFVLPMRGNKK